MARDLGSLNLPVDAGAGAGADAGAGAEQMLTQIMPLPSRERQARSAGEGAPPAASLSSPHRPVEPLLLRGPPQPSITVSKPGSQTNRSVTRKST